MSTARSSDTTTTPTVLLADHKSSAVIDAAEIPYDLKECKEFTPALIYGFEPELCSALMNSSEGDFRLFDSLVQQHKDMFNAYLYAQNVVLPQIKKTEIANLKAEQLIEWVHQIHKRIAKTLAEYQFDKTIAGCYTDRQIVRWHHGADTQIFYGRHLLGYSLDVAGFAKEYGINLATLNKFLKILEKIRNDDSIDIPESEKPFIQWNSPGVVGNLTICKLITLYNEKQLLAEDLKVVNEIVAVSTLPAEIPKRMFTFMQDLLLQWKACDPKNIDQVAQLAQFAFYGFTELHPYFNGNGRTVTCLMNIIFRSLGWPSILMRIPNERSEADSSYSQAIKFINTKPALLTSHIKSRLSEAKSPYQNLDMAENIATRIKFSDLVKEMENSFGSFSAQNFYQNYAVPVGEPFRNFSTLLQQEGTTPKLIKREWQRLVATGHIPKEDESCAVACMLTKAQLIISRNMLHTLKQHQEMLQKKISPSGTGAFTSLAARLFKPPQSSAVMSREIHAQLKEVEENLGLTATAGAKK